MDKVCYDHMKQKTPDPVRSPQLNCLQLRQYYGERSRGNTGCCSFALFYLFDFFLVKECWFGGKEVCPDQNFIDCDLAFLFGFFFGLCKFIEWRRGEEKGLAEGFVMGRWTIFTIVCSEVWSIKAEHDQTIAIIWRNYMGGHVCTAI